MAAFDFTGMRLDGAFRHLCETLYLKAETQQVDRILEAFSKRYWDLNPLSPFGSVDVVHIITYTLLLLNTDLHVVESASRMSRSQFVKNTMTAVRQQSSASANVRSVSPTSMTTPEVATPVDEVNSVIWRRDSHDA